MEGKIRFIAALSVILRRLIVDLARVYNQVPERDTPIKIAT